MADSRQQAIGKAKDAALGSMGFVLRGTPTQAAELKKASLVAARNVVSVRKNITQLVEKFKVYQNTITQIKSILAGKAEAAAKVNRIAVVLAAGGDKYKQEEAEAEQKPKALELVQGAADKIAEATPMAAVLALAIPFLLSPEIKEMISSFFNGFLEKLGFGKDAVDKIKTGLVIATGVLAAYFSAKVLMSVVDAFNQMKKLAEVLGLAGETVSAEKGKIDKEKDDLKKGKDAAKKEVKDAKKEIKKGKKLPFYKKLGYALNVIGPRLKSLAGNILKAIPILGTVLGIGYILYDVFGIGNDLYDMFFGKEKAEDEQDTEQEEAAPVALTSAPESAPQTTFTESTPTPAASSMSEMAPAVSSSEPPSQTEPVQSPSMDGAIVREASVAIEQQDTDLMQSNFTNILTIDNSTTIVDAGSRPIMQSTPMFSMTVGA